jgi:hypothetical protein
VGGGFSSLNGARMPRGPWVSACCDWQKALGIFSVKMKQTEVYFSGDVVV